MREKRNIVIAAILFFVLSLGLITPQMKVEAASVTNVLMAPKAKSGKLIKTASGIRYEYTHNKQFAKGEWLKIGKKIYYFTSKGYAQTKWKTYRGKRYYFDDNGRLVTGWQKVGTSKYYFWKSKEHLSGSAAVGKKKIGSYYYYFSTKGVMQTGWKKISGNYYYFNPASGKMAVNKTIDGYKVDKTGKRVTDASKTSEEKTGKVDIWVGDSRTVGLGTAKKISSKCIAKVGAGYSWYISSAEQTLKTKLKKNPSATVVINFGVNDIDNISKYINRYKTLIKNHPKAKIYFMSVNPIDSKYKAGYVSNSKIKAFNKKLKAAFPKQYIDTYSHMISNGYSTIDGLHYTVATYKMIYTYVISKV